MCLRIFRHYVVSNLFQKLSNSSSRDEIILSEIKAGNCEFKYLPITSKYKEHTATFEVFTDALKIEGVRINVSAKLQQEIADHMGCLLMTAKIADLRHQQADTTLKPHPRYDASGGRLMSTVDWMIWHSNQIDNDLSKLPNDYGIIDTVGKHWIIDDTLSRPKIKNQSVNYGWHYKSGAISGVPRDLPVSYKEMPGVYMIQSRGYHHDYHHIDYSQICVLVARDCVINGSRKDLVEILADEELSYLANHSGKTSVWRQPGVKDPGYVFVIPE